MSGTPRPCRAPTAAPSPSRDSNDTARKLWGFEQLRVYCFGWGIRSWTLIFELGNGIPVCCKRWDLVLTVNPLSKLYLWCFGTLHTGTHTQTCTYLQPAITKQTNSRSIKTKAVVRSCLCRPVAPLSWRSPFPIASLPKDANGVRVAWCPGSPSLIEFALIVRRRSLTVVDMLLEGRGVEPKHIFVSVGCLLLFLSFF